MIEILYFYISIFKNRCHSINIHISETIETGFVFRYKNLYKFSISRSIDNKGFLHYYFLDYSKTDGIFKTANISNIINIIKNEANSQNVII